MFYRSYVSYASYLSQASIDGGHALGLNCMK